MAPRRSEALKAGRGGRWDEMGSSSDGTYQRLYMCIVQKTHHRKQCVHACVCDRGERVTPESGLVGADQDCRVISAHHTEASSASRNCCRPRWHSSTTSCCARTLALASNSSVVVPPTSRLPWRSESGLCWTILSSTGRRSPCSGSGATPELTETRLRTGSPTERRPPAPKATSQWICRTPGLRSENGRGRWRRTERRAIPTCILDPATRTSTAGAEPQWRRISFWRGGQTWRGFSAHLPQNHVSPRISATLFW